VTVRIRAAEPDDVRRLRELTLDSKAHWGYDRDFVARWAAELAFDSEHERWVAEVNGRVVGWAALVPPQGGVAILDDLWIDPAWMRQDIGSQLFHHVATRARALGATAMEWGAEPNSVGFYEKVGGRKLRDHVTEWGRVAPWMGVDL
jgi:N-acetylglutamate synthase-like GNAT family acetyltransferase